MKKWMIILMILLVCGGIYLYDLQFGRASQIITSYKNGSDIYQSVILNVNANKLYLTTSEAEDILCETCFSYGRLARCSDITIYLYKNKYDFLHDKLYCMAEYRSDDLMLYNTKEHPEQFYLEILPASW